jgi:DNA-binding GntR family transcriptional regulator
MSITDALRMEPVEQGNLSARTYSALKDALVGGAFRPGQRLLMQELALQFGTSVTPVREACMRLVAERGLEVRSNRFVTVPDLTLERYMEIRTIRMELEGLAAELGAKNVTTEEVKALADLQTRFETADHAHDPNDAIRINREFHFRVSMGPILNVFYNEVENDYVGAGAHRDLIKALRAKDGRKARAAIEQDIVRGGRALLDYLKRR